MTRIVQIAPAIAPGSGVAGVAFNLEREFRARWVPTARVLDSGSVKFCASA